MTGTTIDTQLLDALRRACDGELAPLNRYLAGRCGLPGPRWNVPLARAAAAGLIGLGPRGRPLLEDMISRPLEVAHSASADQFSVVIAVTAVAMAAQNSKGLTQDLLALQPYAEDPRRHVRDAVRVGLADIIARRGDEGLDALGPWMDGYLQAETALRAMATPEAVQAIHSTQSVLSRLDEAFALLENAPRAHERSHGYRALLHALGDVPSRLGKRFSADIVAWIGANAATPSPTLREGLAQALSTMRQAGARPEEVAKANAAFDASAPPRRDPRSDVGRTRRRGGRK